MKLNEKSIKNDSNINNDFFKNYVLTNHTNDENQNEKLINNYDNVNNKINVDPRLELALQYLDIVHTLEIFVNNYISFNDLLLLSKNDLIELGFSLVERNRIFNFAQEYKNFGVKYNISEINEFFNKYENLNKNYSNQESNYQDTINTNLNYNNNYLENSTKLIRQNSKISKNSSYSKSAKSQLVPVSKFFGSVSGTIIQKYQNISEEIDNYFRKYNDYKEQKKTRMKKYEIMGTSNKRKNNNQIYNNIMRENKIEEKERQENIKKNREDEIKRRLIELQKRKKLLQERLNDICEKDNKRLIIIKYLEEEDK